MRRSELTALDVGDLDAAAQTIHIRKGKGGIGRAVPVGTASLQWIEAYLEGTRPQLIVDAGERRRYPLDTATTRTRTARHHADLYRSGHQGAS